MLPSFEVEESFPRATYVAGIDEVGYGALSGPVVVCAIILDRTKSLCFIRDSKLMSPARREAAYSRIVEDHFYSIGMASSSEVDLLNIRKATCLAYKRAIANLSPSPDVCIIDGIIGLQGCFNVVKGDRISLSIAAASIVAKVFRDNLMVMLHSDYPSYMWSCNKGYGTAHHIESIRAYGESPHHRKSFLKRMFHVELRAPYREPVEF